MKEVIKQYWWIALIIMGAPIVLNYLVFTPSCEQSTGDLKDWISFWGSYLSAIISSMIAFAILVIQRKDNQIENSKNRNNNHTENENNRQLQLNVLAYQQQSQWLNNLREAMIKNIIVYHTNNLREIIILIKNNNLSLGQQKTKDILEKLICTDTEVAMMMPDINIQSDYLIKYNDKRKEVYEKFSAIVKDLQVLSAIFCQQLSIKDIDNALLSAASSNLKMALSAYKPDEKLSYNQVYDISDKIISPMDTLFEEIRKFALSCIGNEQKRIESILK